MSSQNPERPSRPARTRTPRTPRARGPRAELGAAARNSDVYGSGGSVKRLRAASAALSFMDGSRRPGITSPSLAVGVDEERVDGVIVRSVGKRSVSESAFETPFDLVDLREHVFEGALPFPDCHHACALRFGIGSVSRPASRSS